MSAVLPFLRRVAAVVFLLAATGLFAAAGAAGAVRAVGADGAVDDRARIATRETWDWPVTAPFRLERAFDAPPDAYGPGHRGVDLELRGGDDVLAPAGGIVAFSGPVAGRGIITIDHGDGLVTTLEPVGSDLLPGTPLRRGDAVGSLALGGHAVPGRLHFGVRLHGEYVNPLLLLGGVPRAVLLPCC